VRVFLDTNVLVSAFTTRGLCADVVRVVLADHELVVGEVVLQQLRKVLRSKIGFPPRLVANIEALLREHEVVARPHSPADFPARDTSDRYVLASALEGKADVLVTGDRDLLDLEIDPPLIVLDPRGFWSLVSRRAPHPR